MLVSRHNEISISCLRDVRSQHIVTEIISYVFVMACQNPPLKYCGSGLRTRIWIPLTGKNKLLDSQPNQYFSDRCQSGTEKVNSFKDACPQNDAISVTKSLEMQVYSSLL